MDRDEESGDNHFFFNEFEPDENNYVDILVHCEGYMVKDN